MLVKQFVLCTTVFSLVSCTAVLPSSVFLDTAKTKELRKTALDTAKRLDVHPCDVLAAFPDNDDNPQGVNGVETRSIPPKMAVSQCERAVEQFPDNARYKYNLARAYDAALYRIINGSPSVIKKAEAKAIAMYQKAAEQNYAPAQRHLASVYANGTYNTFTGLGFIEKSTSKSLELYKKSAAQGETKAQKALVAAYEKGQLGLAKDYNKAFELLKKLAAKGEVDSQVRLASIYEQHWVDDTRHYHRFVKQSLDKALYWYQKAADQGSAVAQTNLGAMYQDGRGVKQSYEKALSLYRKAAEKNNDAKKYIGMMHEKGMGVEQSYEKALSWYQKAKADYEIARITPIINKQREKQAAEMLGRLFTSVFGSLSDIKESMSSTKIKMINRRGSGWHIQSVILLSNGDRLYPIWCDPGSYRNINYSSYTKLYWTIGPSGANQSYPNLDAAAYASCAHYRKVIGK